MGGFSKTGLVSLVLFFVYIFKPLSDQVLGWLRTGTVPERDVFWATADTRCAATGGKVMGWEGMDLCRPDYIHFSDWVGIDRMMNYVFDLHVALVATVGIAVLWLIASLFRKA